MSYTEPPNTAQGMWHMLLQTYVQGPPQAALVTLLFRMTMEIEAMREALSSPETPEAVRAAYRNAYARTAVAAHNSAGTSSGAEKILGEFLPAEGADDRFAAELVMMRRLGATSHQQRELRREMEFVEQLT